MRPPHCVSEPHDVERPNDPAVLPVADERVRGAHTCRADAAETGRGRLVNDEAPVIERAGEDQEGYVRKLADELRRSDESSELDPRSTTEQVVQMPTADD